MHKELREAPGIPSPGVRGLIAQFSTDEIQSDKERRIKLLAEILTIALYGALEDRLEAATFIENHYGALVVTGQTGAFTETPARVH